MKQRCELQSRLQSPCSTTVSRKKVCIVFHTVKALVVSQGEGLFNFGHSRGGLSERGAYSQNQMTMIHMIASQLFNRIFCGFNIQFNESNT